MTNTTELIKKICEDLTLNFALFTKQKDNILLEITKLKNKQISDLEAIEKLSQNIQTRIDKDTFKNLKEEVKALSYKLM